MENNIHEPTDSMASGVDITVGPLPRELQDVNIMDNHDQEPAKQEKPREVWSGKTEFILSAVGYAVGLGNIWRFPYICYKNGGGVFLLVYVFMLAFAGLPLFFLEMAFGQYASLGPITIWRVCPLFKGVGYSMVGLSLLVSIYYNVIMAFTIFYFFASFTSNLPWSHCQNDWNSLSCSENKTVHNDSDLPSTRSPTQEYFDYYVMGTKNTTTNIEHIGQVRWHMCLCLLLAWIVVFLCIAKGIKSSGKVVYFTATFPYVMLVCLFFRGVTLPGAGEGIKFYLNPNFSKLLEVEVWRDAAVQILYSLGPGFGGLLTMASYNKFNNNCYKDAITVAVINCGTSVFGGFAIFSVIGYMAVHHGIEVDQVVKEGPGLAFVAYPEAIALMPIAPFWAICFFFMLFTLGLDSQFATIECIVTAFVDEYHKLAKHKTLFTAGLCILLFLLGIPCVTQGGMYVVQLLDKYSTTFPILFVTFCETMILSWIYGWRRFRSDIKLMTGKQPNMYWVVMWAFATPCIILFILIAVCVEYKPIEYEYEDKQFYIYPAWANAVGWILSVSVMITIPIVMIIKFWQCVGSCTNLWWLFRGPSTVSNINLRSLIEPTDKWGPRLQDNRVHATVTEHPADTVRLTGRETVSIVTDHPSYTENNIHI